LLTLRWRPSAARASNGEAARMVFVDDVCGFWLCSGLGSFSNGGGEGPSLWVGLPQQRWGADTILSSNDGGEKVA
jgi:hypothetical protein